MLKIAIPEFSSEHGSHTLNSAMQFVLVDHKRVSSMMVPTLGILGHGSHGINRDCGWFQDRVIGSGESVKVVRVLLRTRGPSKVHIGHLRWDCGQIIIQIGIFQMR